MKKTIIGCVIALVFTFLSEACSNGRATQRIKGAGDCINCYGWSWSNGVATAPNEEYGGSFSFRSTVTGDMTFEYAQFYLSWSYGNRLTVYVRNKTYFDLKYKSDDDNDKFIKSSIGSINAGDTVKVWGIGYKIKNIKIAGIPGNNTEDHTTNNKNDNQPQWDF